MAKMFYSLEEAAEKLGKTPDEVRGLVASGQLQEFRDRDRVMLKREQVDLLSADETGGVGGGIPMADSRAGGSGIGLSLEDSAGGSGEIGIDEPAKDRSGISIFEVEETEVSDPSAVTRITETAAGAPEFTLESAGSGSGLLDLTREGDDTSLGADLLEDVYKGDEGELGGADTQGSSGLFEPTPAASDVSAGYGAVPAGAVVLAEPYDGAGSGLVGGFALGITLVAAFALAATLIGLTNSGENAVVNLVAGNLLMWVGILAGVVIVCGVVGLLLGKRS